MSTIKKLAGETIIYGIGAVLPRAMNFLLVASYLTFTMDRVNYGIYGILYAYVTVAMVLFTMRMETAFFKFGAKDNIQDAFNGSMSVVTIASVTFLTIMLLFNKPISGLLTRPEDSRFIIYFGLILLFDALASVPYASLRFQNRPIKFAFIKVANSLLTIGMILFCFEVMPRYFPSWYDKNLLLDYAFLPNVLASGLVLVMLSRELLQFRFKWDPAFWKKLLKFSWPLIIVGVAGGINQFSDRLFVAYLSEGGQEGTQNLASAGLYAGAIKIASLMSLFITAFNYTIEPFFFKNASKKDRSTVYGPIALAYTICAAALFLVIVVNIDVFQLIIGADFREGVYIVPVALMSFLVLGIYYNISIWYKLSGQTIYGAVIASLGTVVFIISNLILIPKMDMIGANYASLICFTFMCVLAYFLGQKKYPIPYPIFDILFYLILAIVLYLIYRCMQIESNLYKTIIGNLLFVIYLFVAYVKDFKKLKAI